MRKKEEEKKRKKITGKKKQRKIKEKKKTWKKKNLGGTEPGTFSLKDYYFAHNAIVFQVFQDCFSIET